jgi:hypothetical protein
MQVIFVTQSLMPERQEQLLQMLLDALRLGPDQLGQALQHFRGELTPALAKQVHEQYDAAFQRQDANAAIAAATLAGRIYNFIGQREEAFNSFVDYLNVLFKLAQSEQEYANVHGSLRQMLAGDPYGKGSPLTALRAAVLGADSAFFACEAAEAEANKKHWLQAALEDLEAGTKFLADPRSVPLIPAYASTTVAVYRRCVLERWSGEPWAASALAALTLVLDQTVPQKVIYPGNDSKTTNISEARAQMSTLYNHSVCTGDPPTGTPISGLFGRKSG